MRLLVRSSKKEQGFSLIEVLVALLLMQLVLLALMESAVLIMNTNLRSKLRDIAVQVTEDEIDTYRNIKFEEILAGTTSGSTTRTIGKATYTFSFTKTVDDDANNPDLKTVQILTTWNFLGNSFSHSLTQVIKK
jgi:prepilin-type N-terminal cleavage/methylation domain-containing protein